MSLRQEQSLFIKDVVKLLMFAEANGYEATGGELQRTPEQQQIYLNTGKTKTLDSYHLKKLAIDLFFFKDGVILQTKDSLQKLGDYWETLYCKNSWGGNWKGGFIDVPHWERRA